MLTPQCLFWSQVNQVSTIAALTTLRQATLGDRGNRSDLLLGLILKAVSQSDVLGQSSAIFTVGELFIIYLETLAPSTIRDFESLQLSCSASQGQCRCNETLDFLSITYGDF